MIERESRVLWKRELGWSHDLPHVDEETVPRFNLEDISPSPNHIDDVYLELSRSTLILRGVLALLGIPALLFFFGLPPWPGA